MSNCCPYPKYPRNWRRISRTIRRIAGGKCEQCGVETVYLSVHHLGAPYADGRPGDPHDKHDCRRENLIALCPPCHGSYGEPLAQMTRRRRARRAHHRAKLEAHRSLGIGTGLVPVMEVTQW